MTQFLQTLTDGLTVGALYALIALGYTMVYGILKFINFAHSDVFALGVHLSIVIASLLGIKALGDTGTPPWYMGALVLVLAMLACGAIGFLVERLAYKPLRSAPRLNVLITAIGVSLLFQNAGQLPWAFGVSPRACHAAARRRAVQHRGRQVPAGARGGAGDGDRADARAAVPHLQYQAGLGDAGGELQHPDGRADGDQRQRDHLVHVRRGLDARRGGRVPVRRLLRRADEADRDSMWVMLGLKAFVAAVVGGIGNVRGAVLGGIMIGLIEFFGVQYVSDQYRDAYVFAILILVLLFKPEGVFGKATVEKV